MAAQPADIVDIVGRCKHCPYSNTKPCEYGKFQFVIKMKKIQNSKKFSSENVLSSLG